MMLHRENRIRQYHTSSAADLLQETMNYYHVTQQDLADKIGVSHKNISDILHRKRFLTELMAVRIEKVTGISSSLLLSLDTNYRLKRAEQEADRNIKHKSPLFLQRYRRANA